MSSGVTTVATIERQEGITARDMAATMPGYAIA